jgi:hypothetical protein
MRGLIFRCIFQLSALQHYSPRHGSRIARGGTKERLPRSLQGRPKIGLTSCVWLTQSVLNRVIRRAIVPRLKGRIRRGVSRLISAAEIKPQLGRVYHGRPVVTPVFVTRLIPRHALPAAISSFRDRRDGDQCSHSDEKSSEAAHMCLCGGLHYTSLHRPCYRGDCQPKPTGRPMLDCRLTRYSRRQLLASAAMAASPVPA